jgi:hypothetical protein
MGNFIFGLAEIAAVIVFIAALTQGKGFWPAVRAGVGVMILGFLAVLALGLLGLAIQLTFGLLTMAFWVFLVYCLVVVVARVIKGATV